MFELDGQIYALPIAPIVQIIEMVTIRPVPQNKGVAEGVINVQGAAVPVIDLRRHLGLPATFLHLHTPIVLVQVDQLTVGLVVDEVMNVIRLVDDQVVRPADILPEELGEVPLLRGLVHVPEGTVLLLDLKHLFLPSQKQALAQVARALLGEEETERLEDRIESEREGPLGQVV